LDFNRCKDALADYPQKKVLEEVINNGIRPTFSTDGVTIADVCNNKTRKTYPLDADQLKTLEINIDKEFRKEKYIILNGSIKDRWKEIILSPVFVVEKGGAGSMKQGKGRSVNDFSSPRGCSINTVSRLGRTYTPSYDQPTKIADAIAKCTDKKAFILAGDVASAFRNCPIAAEFVHLFCFHIPELDLFVIDLYAAFGWSESPGYYDIFGAAISYIVKSSANERSFASHWVDDHTLVSQPNKISDLITLEFNLRNAMVDVLGFSAINEQKYTFWSTRCKVLGLVFDTEQHLVSVPDEKIEKAVGRINGFLSSNLVNRHRYDKLLGTLRHVCMCIRAAKPFLLRLGNEHRAATQQLLPIANQTKADLEWWLKILVRKDLLQGIPVDAFGAMPASKIFILMDASDIGICAIWIEKKEYLQHLFSPEEKELIEKSKHLTGRKNGLNINVREFLSVIAAGMIWGKDWYGHNVRFKIDNTSAVQWVISLKSRNLMAQDLIRILGSLEVQYQYHSTAEHIPGVINLETDAGSRALPNSEKELEFNNYINIYNLKQVPLPVDFYDYLNKWVHQSNTSQ